MVGVRHINEGVVLGQEVVSVDDVHYELLVEPILGDDELLQVLHGDGAGALQEPSIRVFLLRLQAIDSTLGRLGAAKAGLRRI
jgi:hypothetical protein